MEEYNTAQEAEDTMETLKNAKLDDIPVRIQYCIPNIHAINIYMSFVNNPMENRCANHRFILLLLILTPAIIAELKRRL